VTPSAKREVLAVLVQEHHLPVRRACQAVRLSRAAYYRPPASRLARDADIVAALQYNNTGLKMIPTVMPGWDCRPCNPPGTI
jgi:hypothetical protein